MTRKGAVVFVIGFVCGLLSFPVLFYFYAKSGAMPVTTAEAALPFEHFLAKTALHARMDREMPKSAPFSSDQNAWLAGARVYRENCAVCHGVPNRPKKAIASGMFPVPPQLFDEKQMVTDDPAGETYWKAKNGIRLSGMPAFGNSLSDTELWQVSMLLASADKIPNQVVQVLQTEPTSSPAPSNRSQAGLH